MARTEPQVSGALAGVAARYEAEVLQDARAALQGVPYASPYPVFLTREQAACAVRVATALGGLLLKAMRAAAADEGLNGRLLSVVPEALRPLLPPRGGPEHIFFACDLHASEQGTKVIELNGAPGFGYNAGLADDALWPLVSARLEGVRRPNERRFAPFFYEHALRPAHDPRAGAIAFLRGFGNEDMFNVSELEGIARQIEDAGGPRVPLCHERDLELSAGGLYLAGERVDLLYVEENLSDWAKLAAGSPLLEAARRRLVKLSPPLDAFLLTSKVFMALLADPAAQALLEPDEAESEVLRQNVLWSAPLDERSEPAARRMLEEGRGLVLKDALGGGGDGVDVLRPGADPKEAAAVLRRRIENGGTVVQSYFAPGRWSETSELRTDVRLLVSASEDGVCIGPIYARILRGDKLMLKDPDCGLCPVYVVG
jgi:hypothetical protein